MKEDEVIYQFTKSQIEKTAYLKLTHDKNSDVYYVHRTNLTNPMDSTIYPAFSLTEANEIAIRLQKSGDVS